MEDHRIKIGEIFNLIENRNSKKANEAVNEFEAEAFKYLQRGETVVVITRDDFEIPLKERADLDSVLSFLRFCIHIYIPAFDK